jgi:S-layer protein
VTSTATATTGKIDATKATGAVIVTQNINSDGSAAVTGGAITTGGGTTVTINVNANSVATEAGKSAAITIGDISATADAKTTAITVNQNDTVTTFSSAAKAEVVATGTVKFDAVAAGAEVKVGTLEFKAAKALTAAEVAAAFADLTAADTQSAGGLVTNGTYKGSLTAGWTSAAASGDTVVFTGAAHNTAALTPTGAGIKEAKFAAGTDKAAAVATTNKVDFGAVTVVGGKALTSLTLNGYKSAGVTAADALTTLSLTDSAGAATVASAESTTLALTVNNVKHDVTLTASKLATLNLTTAGKDSAFKLIAADTKSLAVSGDKAAVLTGSTLTKLETVTVAGTAGLTLDNTATAITSINTTGTTGAVSASIDGSKATYTGGKGVDTVTLIATDSLTKAIDLGAGDDTLSFGTLAVKGSTAAVAGGEGTDTLAMSSKAAESLSTAAVTFITGFERLTISDNVSAKIDLANLGFTNYVTTSGGTLELNNLANNGTVVVTKATSALTVGIKDAATGTADALNFVLSSEAALAGNTLTAAKVETVKIVSNDTDKTAHNNVLTLTADKATTVTVAGNAGLELTVTGSTLVSLIDGSASTGGLKAATNASAAAATTVKGGTGADDLTANRNQDVLEGGAGKDTLTVAAGVNLATLRGGAGQDAYKIGVASNSNGYATIEGAAVDLAGDTIQFTAAITGFSSAKIVLGATAVFQDYANEAAKAATGSVSWFQWAGDTYLVQDNHADTSFKNGTDSIVKIVGTAVNFSFNSDAPGILEII